MPKPKLRKFNVNSWETCHFEQEVEVPEVLDEDGTYDEAETQDKAIKKAGDIGDWGDPNFDCSEVQDQDAEEITND